MEVSNAAECSLPNATARCPSRPFEYLVLFTIFCNCAALALSKPLPNNDTTPTNSILVIRLALGLPACLPRTCTRRVNFV